MSASLTDLTAEQDLLGYIMTRPDDLYLAEKLRPDHFSDGRNKLIWKTMEQLVQKGESPDGLLVAAKLKNENKLDAIGGRGYLVDLSIESKAFGHNLEHLSNHLIELAMKRKTQRVSAIAIEKIREGINVHDVIQELQNDLIKVSDDATDNKPVLLADAMLEAFDDLLAVHETGKPPGLLSGFSDLDNITSGFKPGDLVVVGARPSMGKSAFAFELAKQAANEGPVVFCSFEMTNKQLAQRALSSISGIEHKQLETGPLEESQVTHTYSVIGEQTEVPLIIAQTEEYSVMQLRSLARKIQTEKKGIAAIVIDYLQLIRTAGNNPNQEIGQITKTLKQLAVSLGVPIILLSQLSRKVESRQDKRPMLSDLRDSGNIEQDADLVLFLYRDEYYNPESPHRGELEVIVAKNRNGECGTAVLLFEKSKVRFMSKHLPTGSRYGHQRSA